MNPKEFIKQVEDLKIHDFEKIEALKKAGYRVTYDGAKQRYFASMDIRAFLLNRIESIGVTPKQMCEAVGYDYYDFRKYERGQRPLPFAVLERIFAILYASM